MKRCKRIIHIFLSLCLFLAMTLPVSAKEEEYTYTIRFFAGKQGSFATGDPDADTSRRKELWEKTRELVAELRYLGVSQEELMALLEEEPSGGAPAGGRKEETR